MGELRYNIELIVANILFGISFSVYVSLLQGGVMPSQLFVLQLLFSMVVSTPLAVLQLDFIRLSLNDFGSIFIVAILVVFGWWYLLIEGAAKTNPIDASTITTIGPLFTFIASIVAHSRRAKWGERIGILVALLGVTVLLFDRGYSIVESGDVGYGNTLVLCAVVAIAINTIMITPTLHRHRTLIIMGWYYLIGTLLALPMIVEVLPTMHNLELTLENKIDICYILLFGSVLPMYLLYNGSKHLTATHTAIYRYIQPIVAAIVAVARGQSVIDRTNIVGAVLIFSGILCVIIATPRQERIANLEGVTRE